MNLKLAEPYHKRSALLVNYQRKESSNASLSLSSTLILKYIISDHILGPNLCRDTQI